MTEPVCTCSGDRTGLVLANGWAAGQKVDAVAEAERKLDALACEKGVSCG